MSTPGTSQFVGTIPELYDRHLGPVIFEPYATDLAARMPQRAGLRVLEVACGTGIVTRRLLERLPADGSLVATDLNDPMLAHACTRVPADARLEWRQADAQQLPFADGAFEFLACQFGVMFFPDKSLAMREARRVLKPGGMMLFNVWDSLEVNAFGRLAHLTIGTFFPEDPPQFYFTPFGWHDRAVIRATVEGAGFSDVRIEAVERAVAAESASHFAIGLVKGNPVMNVIAERGTVAADTIVSAVAQRLAAECGDAPCRGPTRAIVVTATA